MNHFTISCGLPIHVNDSGGEKNVAVLLHGYLETLNIWDKFVEKIEKYFRVIRIDLPGHGLSGTHYTHPAQQNNKTDVYSVNFSAQVVYEILKQQGIEQCIIAGHSMGGYVALAFAKQYPKMVNGLCLFHSTPNADTSQKIDDRDREIALIRANKLSTIIEKSIPNMFATENVKRFSDVIGELMEIAEIHEPEGIIACIEGMKQRPDSNEWLDSFKKSLLFIFGEKDNHIPLDIAQQMTKRFPNAHTLWLKNSGHAGMIEEPATAAEAFIMKFKV